MADCRWVKQLITGVVTCTALCAVALFGGCATGVLAEDRCEGSQERAFGVLSGLLTTVLSLAVKLDALEDKKPRTRTTKPSE